MDRGVPAGRRLERRPRDHDLAVALRALPQPVDALGQGESGQRGLHPSAGGRTRRRSGCRRRTRTCSAGPPEDRVLPPTTWLASSTSTFLPFAARYAPHVRPPWTGPHHHGVPGLGGRRGWRSRGSWSDHRLTFGQVDTVAESGCSSRYSHVVHEPVPRLSFTSDSLSGSWILVEHQAEHDRRDGRRADARPRTTRRSSGKRPTNSGAATGTSPAPSAVATISRLRLLLKDTRRRLHAAGGDRAEQHDAGAAQDR